MIKAVLIFNNHGKPRLMQWYQQLDVNTQQEMLKEIFSLVQKRQHYATLYFVFVVDSSESELGILDLIQVFVEALDRIFTNVCELDLIFRPDDIYAMLSEIISGGMVLETSVHDIVSMVDIKKPK
ncbi:hypothetical protein SmJEL517_g03780 [Synchytrium microbalum]|uniref:AP complex subunit sigma n=1 Tax=Synchytrium microbalum TaxID=1806994 RepID=A0A507C2S8_9FUNG|nr:uncharacterized protein SmJEL517_g03780 [Synchytrium microbalum]TPX33349.1 hypothetical protein SmJEL517_g03780 [Synchytrium microbalum]